MNKIFSLISILVISISSVLAGNYGNVTIAWDASPSTNVIGYKGYYGSLTNMNALTNVINASNQLTCTFTNLQKTKRYYFTATAYNSNMIESKFAPLFPYTFPSNTIPTFGTVSITNQSVLMNSTLILPFIVVDDDPYTMLTVSGRSSNTNIVPNSKIVISYQSNYLTTKYYTAAITPLTNTYGDVNITLSVGDGALTNNSLFVLTVTDVPLPPVNLRIINLD